MTDLRPYQQEALDAIMEFFEYQDGKSCLCVMPTGSGKSILIAALIKHIVSESPHVRFMVITHLRELLTQNEKELKSFFPQVTTGFYSAGLGEKETNAQVIFATIQTVYNKVFSFPKIDIVIADEAHLIGREDSTRYQTFFRDMRVASPHVAIIGATATPFRLDSGLLTEGENPLFDRVAYNIGVRRLIDEGYLVPVVSKGGIKKIDLTDVRIRAGEYDQSALAHAADDPTLIKKAVNEIVTYGKDRNAWIVFCSGVMHAKHVAAEINTHGIDCEVLTGETPTAERDNMVARFAAGKLRAIANVGIMSTGMNIPRCDLIALLTSTCSAARYIQMVGRGTRTFPGKENVLLLDFGGNCERLGLIDEIDPLKRKTAFNEPTKPAPQKSCPKCNAIVAARAMVCPWCNFEFPVSAPHDATAYAGAVMSGQYTPVDIVDFWVSKHDKPGKTPSVKVSFYDAVDHEYNMWLALDHGGFAAQNARNIVKQFGGTATTVAAALDEWKHWKKPVSILVTKEGKWDRVVRMKLVSSDVTAKGFVDGKQQTLGL
jgi:DNA repair protein RadD